MKKLFPFDHCQPFLDQINSANHNTAVHGNDARASPFEGTRRMYHSIGGKGREQGSLSLIDGCDILKYTSSSEQSSQRKSEDGQFSKRQSQNIKPRMNSMDRLSSTMKCSLGKINLNQHLNNGFVESALKSVRKDPLGDADVAQESHSENNKKPNQQSSP